MYVLYTSFLWQSVCALLCLLQILSADLPIQRVCGLCAQMPDKGKAKSSAANERKAAREARTRGQPLTLVVYFWPRLFFLFSFFVLIFYMWIY